MKLVLRSINANVEREFASTTRSWAIARKLNDMLAAD
jgi:hypothetical protein